MSDLWSENEGRSGNMPPGEVRRAPSPPPIVRSGPPGADQGQRVRRWASRTGELFGGQPAAPAPTQIAPRRDTASGGRYVILVAALLGCAVVGFAAFVLGGGGESTEAEGDSVLAGPEISTGVAEDSLLDAEVDGSSGSDPAVVGDTTDVEPSGDPVDDIGLAASEDLVSATVQLFALNAEDQPVCGGSGIVVEANGLILTNAHVVQPDENCDTKSIGVAVTGNDEEAPELQYRASVLVVDEILDLAVLQIDESIGGAPAILGGFVAAPLGDSDSVELGDQIRILGYPVIGGETITSTSGTVSGFTDQVGIGSRAMIKTDAGISAGNSGGMAVDNDGRVIGVPTRARASESGPALDCRALEDSNGDGVVDDNDVCVPVGGFLNSIRPINLARPLLDRALALDVQLDAVAQETRTRLADVTVANPRFSSGQADNEPQQVAESFESGVADLCLFVDWAGMPEDVVWDAVWEFNGSPIPQLGHYEEVWVHGDEGRNFWICAEAADGHEAGLYEVGLFLDGTLAFAEGVVVSPTPLTSYEVTWVNDSDRVICELAINPLSRSGQVGVNELERGQQIEAGRSVTMMLPEGLYAVEARDCDGTVLADYPAGGIQVPDLGQSADGAVVYVLTARG